MRFCTRLRSVVCVLALLLLLGIDVAFAADDLTNTPPEDPPFYGGYYFTGYSAALGNCTIYVPVGEGWSLDQYGFLFHCGTSSVTGVLYTEDGTEYTFNAPVYSTPRYRLSDGIGYSYTDLYFTPSASNVVVATEFEPVYDQYYMLLLIAICFLGGSFVFSVLHRR